MADSEYVFSEARFGIVCLTEANQNSTWILFEAGALAKTIDNTSVCPYLIDIDPVNLSAGPLAQFQAKRANEKETWELVTGMNRALKESSLPEDGLRRAFDRWWPDLEQALGDLPSDGTEESQRSLDDKTDEILGLVRVLSREHLGGKSDVTRQTPGLGAASSALRDLSAALHSQTGSLEQLMDVVRPFRIQVDLGTATESGRVVAIRILPKETVFVTLSSIWAEIQESEAPPPAFTYLWDWVLVRQTDQMALMMAGKLTKEVLSHSVFSEGEEWLVVRLDLPLISRGERFRLVRGEPYR